MNRIQTAIYYDINNPMSNGFLRNIRDNLSNELIDIYCRKSKEISKTYREAQWNRNEEDKRTNKIPVSDMVLRLLTPDLQAAGYRVETSKKKEGKISIDIPKNIYNLESCVYELDSIKEIPGLSIIHEVNAGRAFENRDYMKNLLYFSTYQRLTGNHVLGVISLPNTYVYGKGNRSKNSPFNKVRQELGNLIWSNMSEMNNLDVLLIGYGDIY